MQDEYQLNNNEILLFIQIFIRIIIIITTVVYINKKKWFVLKLINKIIERKKIINLK